MSFSLSSYRLAGLGCALALLAATSPVLAGAARAQDASGAEAVQRAAEQILAERFPASAERMDVRVRRTGGTITAGAPMRLDFAGRRGGAPEGLTRAQVNTRTAGRWEKAGWATLYVAHFDSVVTARQRIRPGDAVTPDQVEVAWTETTDLRGEPLRANDFRAQAADAPVVAKRLLRAGRVLRRRDVRAPYAVDVSTPVEMEYTRGRLTFRLACKAREPGFAEDTIRLYCPSTRTSYRARLTGERTADWIETL